MVWLLELFLVGVFLSVNLSHGLPSAHIPALNAVFDFIKFGVSNEVLMAVGVQIIGNHMKAFFGSSDGQRTNTTKDISKQLSAMHDAQDPISFLLEPGAPVNLFKIEFKLYSLFS